MSLPVRLRAGFALVWYLAVGFGLPLVDGLWYHDGDASPTAHVESSDAQCHRGECSLDAPGAPQSPAGRPVASLRAELLPLSTPDLRSTDVLPGRSPARAHAPRAPPHFT